MNTTTIRSYAKFNKRLTILNKRSDGYHNIISTMQYLNLHDTIHITKRTDKTITITYQFTTPPNSPPPKTEDDLMYKACKALNRGATITIHKNIPITSGLGGGSSNAAATLQAISSLYSLSTPLTPIANTLGSDVPFFLHKTAMQATNKGTTLTPNAPPTNSYLLITPTFTKPSTTTMYQHIIPQQHPHNDFQPVALQQSPQLQELFHQFKQHNPHLCGSGYSFVIPNNNQTNPQTIKHLLKNHLIHSIYPVSSYNIIPTGE